MNREITPYTMEDVAATLENIDNMLQLIAGWMDFGPNDNTPSEKCRDVSLEFLNDLPLYQSAMTATIVLLRDLRGGVDAALEIEQAQANAARALRDCSGIMSRAANDAGRAVRDAMKKEGV